MHLNGDQGKHARDTLIKTVYTGLFEWVVQQINRKLHSGGLESANNFIGILDMPGFGKYGFITFEPNLKFVVDIIFNPLI